VNVVQNIESEIKRATALADELELLKAKRIKVIPSNGTSNGHS